MGTGVADCAKRDQVRCGVIPLATPKLFVVDFKVRHPAARLAPPAIATQDLLPEGLMCGSI